MTPAVWRIAVFAAICVFSSSAQSTPSALAVANYAGFTGAFPLAPGSIASAYGDFGSIATTATPSLTPMSRELSGVRVRVGSSDAPLYFVSRNQINFIIPSATSTGRQTVEVLSGSNVVGRGFVNVYSIGPGLAALSAAPSRPGIVQNQNFAVNGQDSRARQGEIVQIYATGCGTLTPAVPDDRPPSDLARAVADVRVYFLDREVTPQFACAHPQFPGICQINAAVPQARAVTGQVPLYVTVNGIPSNTVSVWVQ